MTQRDFIETLIRDLRPVRPAVSLPRAAFAWTAVAWILVLVFLSGTGSFRDAAIATLAESPRYATEFALGVLGGFSALVAGLELGVPGTEHPGRRLAWPVLLLASWIAIVGYGVFDPVIETGVRGMRRFCDVEIVVFALPPLAIALFILRRRALFAQGAAGVFLGLGAAAIPGVSMQLACLYNPAHALVYHLAPVAVVGVLGGVAAHWTRQRF